MTTISGRSWLGCAGSGGKEADMDVFQAIEKRQSIRGFLSHPVSRGILSQVLAAGQKAPSAMNSQPWEFMAVSGRALDDIKRDNAACFRSGEKPAPELEPGIWPRESRYRRNQVALAKQLFEAMGIAHEDREARNSWAERGFRLFDAPAAIFLCVDSSLSECGPLMDLGAAMQTICLASVSLGLGTCIATQGVSYPGVIRKHTGLPQDKRLLLAIAVGYPDWSFPANRVVTEREDLEAVTSWVDVPEQE
jgi:nitroreductase